MSPQDVEQVLRNVCETVVKATHVHHTTQDMHIQCTCTPIHMYTNTHVHDTILYMYVSESVESIGSELCL